MSYKLTGNKIRVVWHVENTDDKEIYFQVGGHPAFMVPGAKSGEPIKGALRFDNPEPMRVFISKEGFLTKGYHEVPTDNGLFAFTEDTFKDDAIVFDPCGKHAPFICIEPWYGVADWEGYDGELKDKYLINKLLPGSSFMSEYVITIG